MLSKFCLASFKIHKCNTTRNSSWWSKVTLRPPDQIFGLVEVFRQDSNPKKLLLAVGAYRDDDGKPYVLPCIRKAEERLFEKKLDKEYPPVNGPPEFCQLAAEVAFGECSEITSNGLNATVQSLSGSGGLNLGAIFLRNHFPGNKLIYAPKPTWANHNEILVSAGLEVCEYRYYHPKTFALDFEGLKEDICRMPEESIVLVHVCAHNPTGVDPSCEQWKQISKLFKERNLFCFFDMAYQGFVSGDAEKDAFAVRQFTEDCNQFLLAQSFSKILGLYGERIGTLSVVTCSKEETAKVMSQLKAIIRAIYSVPPVHGQRLVVEVLSDPELRKQWKIELKCMVQRLIAMREALVENLKKAGSTRNWDHVTNQVGMFAFTGLTAEQVTKLIKEYGVYLTKDGRMSVAGLTPKNVSYVAKAIHDVTK